MPIRRTLRGSARTPLDGEHDVLICGASFAGLAVARELAGSGARVLVLDRYEIGERQTSACGIPTAWLRELGLMGAHRQTFGRLVVHTPHGTSVLDLPWTFSTFDYPELCRLLWEQTDAVFETAKVHGRSGNTVHTDRGDLTAPLVVDALGWRRMLGPRATSPPMRRCRVASRCTPGAPATSSRSGSTAATSPRVTAGASRLPDEVRVGVGSFDPRFHVKDTTVLLAEDTGRDPVRYQGNWIPHKLRAATEDGIFFVGDSAGHCLPLTAEGIRTALYFGIACGRELRAVVEGRQPAASALVRYGDFSAAHEWKFRWMLETQHLVPRVPPRLLNLGLKGIRTRRFVDWSFKHYLAIAPPEFARASPRRRCGRGAPVRAAA